MTWLRRVDAWSRQVDSWPRRADRWLLDRVNATSASEPTNNALRHSEAVGDYAETDVGVWTKDGFVPEDPYIAEGTHGVWVTERPFGP